ncbi:MAG: MarR family transcriptional regulator [Micrococcaceae bacterium]
MDVARAENEEKISELLDEYFVAIASFDQQFARVLNVNTTDLHCLEILLNKDDGVAPSYLAKRLNLTTGSVTTMLDRLEKMEYVERIPHSSDRRKTVVQATLKVAKLAFKVPTPTALVGKMEFLDGYDDNELNTIVDFFKRAKMATERQTARLPKSL